MNSIRDTLLLYRKSSKYKHFRLISNILTGIAILAVEGCTGSVKTACEQYFPDFDSRLENGALALAPWDVSPTAKRGLASIPVSPRSSSAFPETPENPEHFIMSQSDRESWSNWSKALLDQTQDMLDAMEQRGDMHKEALELHRAANYLVMAGGYAIKGDAPKMILTIKKVRERAKAAHDLACTKPI